MIGKIIKDEQDKKEAVVVITGVVALARLIGGEELEDYKEGEFLKSSKKLAGEYVDMVQEIEK